MKDKTKYKGRCFCFCGCLSALATNLVKLIILLLAFAALPTLSFVCCEKVDLKGVPADGTEVRNQESCSTKFSIGIEEGVLDLFIYKDQGLRPLEKHIRFCVDSLVPEGSGRTLSYEGSVGDKLFVCIRSDGRLVWNPTALDRYEAMEQLSFRLADESPSLPYSVCFGQFQQGDSVVLKPVPLLREIRLRSISHQFEKYRRLEDPVFCLRGANASVCALQESKFQVYDHLYDTTGLRGLVWDRLPCDVGLYPQYPYLSLWSYPFESSVTPLEVIVEGIYCTDTVQFTTTLDSLSGLVELDLEIGTDPSDYRFSLN